MVDGRANGGDGVLHGGEAEDGVPVASATGQEKENQRLGWGWKAGLGMPVLSS